MAGVSRRICKKRVKEDDHDRIGLPQNSVDPGELEREEVLRLRRQAALRLKLDKARRVGRLTPLDIAFGAAAAEIARQIIRRGLRLLLK